MRCSLFNNLPILLQLYALVMDALVQLQAFGVHLIYRGFKPVDVFAASLAGLPGLERSSHNRSLLKIV
jgi:hypothetical protein